MSLLDLNQTHEIFLKENHGIWNFSVTRLLYTCVAGLRKALKLQKNQKTEEKGDFNKL